MKWNVYWEKEENLGMEKVQENRKRKYEVRVFPPSSYSV